MEKEILPKELIFSRRELPTDFLHWHDSIEICQMISGTAQFTVGDTTYLFSPGDIITVPARELHLFQCQGHNLVNICLIPLQELTKWLDHVPTILPHIVYAQLQGIAGIEKQITDIFDKMYSEFSDHKLYHRELMLMQSLSMYMLLSRYFQTVTFTSGQYLHIIQPILDEIAQDCAYPYSLSYFAQKLNYTPEYLSSIFRKCIGRGFKEYLDIQRITEAKRMLVSMDTSIAVVAQRCGYDNIRTFNNRFKMLAHMTPSEFIEQFRVH